MKNDTPKSVDLKQLEAVIATSQKWQIEAAKALVTIHRLKLYRPDYKTFEQYASQRWNYDRSYLYRLLQLGTVAANLSKSPIGSAHKLRESHARQMVGLSADQQRQVFDEAMKQHGAPTANQLALIARQFKPKLSAKVPGALSYYGSKASIASQVVALMPSHRCYVEPFCGSAAVLLAKPPSHVEVLNDKDESLINWFRVLRSNTKELIRRLKLTPYAREEWEQCHSTYADPALDDVERARRFYVMLQQSYSATGDSWSRSNTKPQGKYWSNRIDRMPQVAERLRPVMFDAGDAVDIIRHFDDAQTLFYVDPPYLLETRSGGGRYKHEMDDAQHQQLLAKLNEAKGKVILSGYDSDLYRRELRGWRKALELLVAVPSGNRCPGRRESRKTEHVWCNF